MSEDLNGLAKDIFESQIDRVHTTRDRLHSIQIVRYGKKFQTAFLDDRGMIWFSVISDDFLGGILSGLTRLEAMKVEMTISPDTLKINDDAKG
jgi:hypothetical protein